MTYKTFSIHLTPDDAFSNNKDEGFVIEIKNKNSIVKSFRSPWASKAGAVEEAKRAIDRGCKPGIFQ